MNAEDTGEPEKRIGPYQRADETGYYARVGLESARTQCAVDHQGLSESFNKLNIAGIFHTHVPEKGHTDGGATASRMPLRTGLQAGTSWNTLVRQQRALCAE